MQVKLCDPHLSALEVRFSRRGAIQIYVYLTFTFTHADDSPGSKAFICVCDVCVCVCPQHNSKTNEDKVFKLGVGNDLGISGVVLGQRSRSQGHKVQKHIEGDGMEFVPLSYAHHLVCCCVKL